MIIYRNGAFSEIDISGIPMARHVCVQDGKIAVIDTFNKMTGLYSLEGECIISIFHPEELKRDTPVAVVGIDGNSLIWETDSGLRYRYNWTKRTLEALEDRAIVFQEWPDGHRSYMECIRMEDGSGYRIAKSGYDCWGAGFEVLREYLAKYYPELKDTNPE